MNPNTQNANTASNTNEPTIRVALFMNVVWAEFAQFFTPNDQRSHAGPVGLDWIRDALPALADANGYAATSAKPTHPR